MKKVFIFSFFLLIESLGERVYLSPRDFVTSHLPDYPIHLKHINLSKENQKTINNLIGQNYPLNKFRFWKKNDITLWILEDIGKTERITMGFAIEKDKISSVEILIYRESHGSEVRSKSFTKQFKGAMLKKKGLDRSISNIAGATLSVEAVKRMSILALYLHYLAKKIYK